MTKETVYPVPAALARTAHVDEKEYQRLYARSVEMPELFWREQAADFLDWFKPFSSVRHVDMQAGHFRWFEGGRLNASYNCLDRHLPTRGDHTALIWESDDAEECRCLSYRELHEQVCRFANVLKSRGVQKGDTVCIYMPMVPEAVVAMLACTRIGAVHSVVFGGFSPQSLRDRILDSGSRIIITADEGVRGGRAVPLKANTDAALEGYPDVKTVIVLQRTNADVSYVSERDFQYGPLVAEASPECEAESLDAESPMFILYTSGSTGKPKGIVHHTGGYLLGAALTFKYVFDIKEGDIYWCTADIGWITGHTYALYGPLLNGATTLIFEGVPHLPTASRCWEVVDKHQVSIFYTAPTAIRQLMGEGNEYVRCTARTSLRLLGTVGEPINPEAWQWYYQVVGEERCPIVDTWWQTETGAVMIAPLPGAIALKPGSATLPFFGVQPALLDENGQEIEGAGRGDLVIKEGWPSQLRTLHGDHQRMLDVYFSKYPGYYFTGDGARRDEDGYYWITGRVDDVLNVSGHRLSTAEIESALVLHEAVAEAAVVGCPHDIKGEAVYAYVTLMAGQSPSDQLEQTLVRLVRTQIGAMAKPDYIQWAPTLPKTRSGKIMRRILRKIAAGEDDLGDTSTLADPGVINDLTANSLR